MGRKYLDELKADFYMYGMLDDARQANWKEEQAEYGFDERETWSMPFSFACWLYERLMMYDNINPVDMLYHKFKIGDEVLTQQECLDRMLEVLRKLIAGPENSGYLSIDEEDNLWDKLLPIFSESIRAFWW